VLGLVLRLVALAGLLAVAYLAGQGRLAGIAGRTAAPIEVDVARAVVEGDAAGGSGTASAGRVTASGYVVARTKAGLSFKVPGRISEIRRREGEKVVASEVLARLDDREQVAALDRARAALATAKAALAELEAGSREQEIARARSLLAEAEAGQRLAVQTLARHEALLARGGISRQQVDTSRMSAQTAAAQVQSARQSLSMLKEGARREQVRTQKARVVEAEAAVRVAEQALAETVLKAPFPGVIIDRHAEVGETLSFSGDARQPAGILVMTLADLERMEAEVDISESSLAQIPPGGPAEVVTDAYPDRRYRGRTRMIMPRANRQKAIVPVKVTILDPDDRLRPDMSAKVTFLPPGAPEGRGGASGASERPRVLVPRRALLRQQDRWIVYTVQGGVARAAGVTPGEERGERVQVVVGLAGGEDVVVGGFANLTDGASVKPRQERTQ
jgi:HlyD family secretion protein